jgi:hypothetical protein
MRSAGAAIATNPRSRAGACAIAWRFRNRTTPRRSSTRERDNGGPVRRTRPGRRGRRVVQKELPFACLRRTSRHVRRLHCGERRGARPSQHIQSSGFAFVALACMSSAPGRIGGWLRHPMLVAVKIWALAHLLANGDAAACCSSDRFSLGCLRSHRRQ